MIKRQIILSFYAVLFILFGTTALLAPTLISNVIHFELKTLSAEMEFIATYGGLFLGLGLFMLYCIQNNTDIGLVCVLLTMGVMLLSRVSGAFIFGGVDLIQAIYISGELFTTLLVIFLLYNARVASLILPQKSN